MSEIRHRDRILEAIDQLRKRKARPDVNRICSFMFRRFAVNCIETKLDLQKLIDAEIVIKVDYKGNTSYRNAAKWAMLPSYKYKKEIDTSSIISSAVAELIVLEPDYLDIGVPGFELEAHMQQKDTKRFSKKNLEAILKREVEIGTLVKLENGNYFLGEHSSMNSNSTMDRPSASRVGSPAKQSSKANLASKQTSRQKKVKLLSPKHSDNSNDSDKMKVDDHSNSSESTNVGFRVGGRQKRARIVFDPSDNNLPTRVKKRGPGRPLGSLNKSTAVPNPGGVPSTPPLGAPAAITSPRLTQSAPATPKYSVNPGVQIKTYKTQEVTEVPGNIMCSVCHSSADRVKGVPQRLISCSDCTNRAHRGCLENGVEGYDRDGLWRCLRCKSCAVCDETAEAGSLSICVVCHDAYHHQCHSPPVPERYRTKQIPWHCSKCPNTNPPEPPVEEATVKEKPPVVKEKLVERPVTPPKKETTVIPPPPPPPPEPKVRDLPANCLQDPFEDIPIDESIPDAKHWSTNQVYQYFSTHFKPEVAQIFKDQDVDGQSLLLMKRMDVLTNLSLKLGPALKVYGHVRKLQTRKSHPKILWS